MIHQRKTTFRHRKIIFRHTNTSFRGNSEIQHLTSETGNDKVRYLAVDLENSPLPCFLQYHHKNDHSPVVIFCYSQPPKNNQITN
jgi:hypothetical protein